ncbi:hypothetical protein PH562_02640 [Rhizobium sp. CNPSo 4062]|uniref:hypothetical protein n=1 Tax=Rhizobium sp. CNPSo 4062 TaxID=3021410 RepID=UPI00255034D2|nr:hypothetical protein [Rhizobium sp. CNPSo 4062]MDK4701120.1 hypothetical protein [Rhizobium sp. CNPSo 4062]
MIDVATLGISVDSSNVRAAADDFDGFAAAMNRVVRGSGAVSRALKTMNNDAKIMGGVVDKTIAQINKFGAGSAPLVNRFQGALAALNTPSNDRGFASQSSNVRSQANAPTSAQLNHTGNEQYDYFLDHRAEFAADLGPGVLDNLVSAASILTKAVVGLIPIAGDQASTVAGDWVDSFSPSNMRQKSEADARAKGDRARRLMALPGAKDDPVIARYAGVMIPRDETLTKTFEFHKGAKDFFDQALNNLNSALSDIEPQLSFPPSASGPDNPLFAAQKSYEEVMSKFKAEANPINALFNLDKALSDAAAKMSDVPEIAASSAKLKVALGPIKDDLSLANGLMAKHNAANKEKPASLNNIKQSIFAESGTTASILLPNIAAFSRVSPLAIETKSKQSIAGSAGVQNSQKDELQGIQQATDALTKSSKDNTEQVKVGIQTSAQSAAATDNVKSKVVTLKQSQDELQKSCAVQLAQMPQLTKAANDQADAYRRVADAQALQKLAGDIQFQQEQMGRSTIDQTVASTQKQYGLPVDMNSASANIIRYNEQLKYARELAGDFASTLVSGLRNGEGLWKSLGKAAISVLTKISDRLLNDVLNSLFKVNSAAAGGGLFGGGGIGGLFSNLFGFGSGGGFNIGSNATVPTSGFDPFSALSAGWADGGYTGPGTTYEPAGIVHAGEVVWSQRDIARAGGVGVVEAMRLGRRGYADGGVVGEGGPQLLRAQPDAAVPVRRLRADNQNDASGSASGVHVTVGVSVDEDGNLKAYVKNVAQSEAQSSTRQGLNDFNQQLPDRVAQINRNPRRR